jgi:hypothetical protein
MKMAKIKVEFKSGKKIVTHPDGSVKKYTKADTEKQKDYFLRRRQDLDRQIAHIDEDLVNIDKSVTKKKAV